MTAIKITPENVTQTGNTFSQKQQEMTDLTTKANSMMSSLQGEFMGNRATKIFQQWDGLKPSLAKAQETLRTASDVLKQAANAFSQVDGQG